MKSTIRATAFAAYVFLPIIILTLALGLTLTGSEGGAIHLKHMQDNDLFIKKEAKKGNAVFLLSSPLQQTFFYHF